MVIQWLKGAWSFAFFQHIDIKPNSGVQGKWELLWRIIQAKFRRQEKSRRWELGKNIGFQISSQIARIQSSNKMHLALFEEMPTSRKYITVLLECIGIESSPQAGSHEIKAHKKPIRFEIRKGILGRNPIFPIHLMGFLKANAHIKLLRLYYAGVK